MVGQRIRDALNGGLACPLSLSAPSGALVQLNLLVGRMLK